MRKRVLRIALIYSVIMILGLFYAYIIIPMGIAIPCKFNLITGLSCPGCGITGACLNILKLDFVSAVKCNIGLFIELPFIAYIIIDSTIQYVKGQKQKEYRVIGISLILGLVVWFLIRNYIGI